MANNFIRVPVDDVGKRLDTWDVVVGVNTVHREVDRIGGSADVEIADVRGTDPNAGDYGLVVRQAPPDSAKVDYATSADLAQGASADLDATTIGAGTTGKLLKVLVGSSVACKWDVKTRDGASEVTKAVFYTSGLGGRPSDTYVPSSKEGVTLAGAGVDENFRVTATNLDGSETADVHATIEWDEV